MKRNVKIIAIFALIAITLGSFVSCKKEKSQSSKTKTFKENPASDFKYTMTADGKGVRITKYIGKSPKIIIPSVIEDLPVLEVTGLADLDHEGKKFYNEYLGRWVTPKSNITITHISFPDSVKITYTDIGNGYYPNISLYNYDALEYIKFSPIVSKKDNIEEWSRPEVSNCDKLKTVIIPEGVKVLPNFTDCKALETIELPSTIERISGTAFSNCTSLKEIIIPESITKITFEEINYQPEQTFLGTNLNLATQTRLKQLGYKGLF